MNNNINSLTSKQKEAYLAIEAFISSKKIPPTVRELGEILGEKTPGAVQGIINRLVEKGVIKKELGVARSIQLVNSNSMYLPAVYVPELRRINKRNINDFLNIYNIIAYHPVSAELLGNAEDCFFIDCPDNSLTNKNLKYGDTLLVNINTNLNDGDVILVFYDNHLLLRYFYFSKNASRLILKADSDLFNKEEFDKDEVTIIGKVVSKIQSL